MIEQISFLLFIKRLDDIHTAKEKKANRLNKPIEEPIFTAGQENLRWSRFKEFEAEEMFKTVSTEVFPFIKNLHDGEDSAYSHHMAAAFYHFCSHCSVHQRRKTVLPRCDKTWTSGPMVRGEL